MRNFLFYVSCPRGKCEAELFGENRLYDVAINDYTCNNINPSEAEYKFSDNEWKFRHVHDKLSEIVFNYEACAIFDDDVKISTEDLNKLFLFGINNKYNIWQASLTTNSFSSWTHLYKVDNSMARLTNTIELMMPIFSKDALSKCFDTFTLSYSGWGINDIWFERMNNEGVMVVDCISATHVRPISPDTRKMPNGLSCRQEFFILAKDYNIALNKRRF